MDVDRVLLDAHIIKSFDHLELILPQSEGWEFERSTLLGLCRSFDVGDRVLTLEPGGGRLSGRCHLLAIRTQILLLVSIVNVLKHILSFLSSSVEHEWNAVTTCLDTSTTCLVQADALLAAERLYGGVAQEERSTDWDENDEEGEQRKAAEDCSCRSSQTLDQGWCRLLLLWRNRIATVNDDFLVPREVVDLDLIWLDKGVCLRNTGGVVSHSTVVHHVCVKTLVLELC